MSGQTGNNTRVPTLWEDITRILLNVTDTARTQHESYVLTYSTGTLGHSALTEQGGFDLACKACGAINEAEYLLAELQAEGFI